MLSISPKYAKRIIPTIIHLYSTIFKTIDDETTISGQRIVGALQARKIVQEQATAQLEIDIACLKKYKIACQSGSVSTEQFDSIMKKSSVTAKEYTTNIQKGTGSAQSYAQAQKANNAALQSVGVGAGIASKAVKLLSATMSTIAFTAIFSLISKGISLVTEQIDNYIHRNKIAIAKAEELLDTFKSEIDTITSNQDKINSYADEFKELSRGVDDLGNNVSLTADEYARYQSIVKEIVRINPSLISGYDEENNILANKNGLIETSIQLLKEEYNQKLKNIALPDNIDTAIEGAIGRYNSSKEDFLEVEIPTTLAFSGVKIDENGNRETGYANQISQYIEDVIGVEYTSWEGGINQYILDNAEAVFDNLDKIKERASQTKDGWEGLNDSQLIDLMDYFKELRIAYNDMNNATTSVNPTLQYVAMAEDSYSQLTDIQKKFVADYVNGTQITSETTEQEKDNIRKSIISLTQELSKLDDTEVNNALTDLYAIPTDEQSIDEFIEQFRNALEVIQAYCKENDIELPIAISDSEQSINDLEAQYQRAVDFAKDNFDGYDPTAFFKEHSINTQEEIGAWLKIAQGARDAAEAEKEYVQSSTLNYENPNLSSHLTSSQESLDKFQSSIKSASDAYTTLLFGNYSTSELLNSLQAINQAIGDMGGSLNWEYINQSEDSLKLLGDTIEHISQKYAESVLSGAGIDVDSDFGRMLADIIQETYEAEAKFTDMNAQLDALQSSYQTLTGILESYNDTGYISLDNLQSLLTADENLISMLEVENGQLVLNQEAYENLVAVQLLEFKEKLNNAAAAEIEALAKQKSEEATNNNAQASEDAVAKLDAETEAFNRNTSAAITNAVTKAEEEGVSEDEIQSVLDKYNEIWNAAVNNFDGDFDCFMGGTKSADAAGSSAGNAYVDAFEEELKELDDLHSNSFISEKEYLDRLRVLYERYFKDKLGYEKEFANYQKKYLDGYKSLYESVFSHASKVIGDRIDAINDEKDAAIDSLEAQKKAAEDSYNSQIKLLEDKKDALQAEIDKINEANEERRQSIDLQKAEYELARIQNQRTILQYSEDKGVHYVTDTSGIRDAKNDLDDKKADAQIRALEKQQDALDKQIDAIQKMLDASNEYWDTQIEQTEKYYDAMIQGMEEYKSRWEELSDLQEHAEMIALLEELGYTEEDLLDAGSGAFDRFRTSYLGILKDMNDGNQSVLDGLSQLANINMSNIPGFLAETQGYIDSIAGMDVTAISDELNNVCDGFSNVADSAASAASAISGGGNVSARSNNQTSDTPPSGGTGNNSSLKDAITEASKGSVAEINKISDAFAGENEEGDSVTGAIRKVMDKIGSTDSDKEGSDSLMSTLAEQTKAALDEENGIPAQKTAWGELNAPLGESVDLVTTLQSTLADMDGRTFTVTLNVVSNGAPNSIVSEFYGSGSNSPGNGNIGKWRVPVQGTAHIEGITAARGNWGIKEAGRSLVGELGQELWVHSKDGTFETVGDNGVELINTEKGDLIFNHLQTKELLSKGNIVRNGRTYANGTIQYSDGTIIRSDGSTLRPLREGDRGWNLMQKFQPLADRMLKGETDIMSNAMIEHQKQMEQLAGDITTMNVTTNNKPSVTIGDIHVTCPGVTSKEVAKQVGVELNNMFSGLHLDAMQQSMMR